MHLTSSQKKAALFIVIFFSLALIYHFLDRALHPLKPYDFSAFEEKFYARYDSIRQILQEDSNYYASGVSAINNRPANATFSGRKASQLPGGRETTASAAARHDSALPDTLVNINSAGMEELTALPRIGPKIAARIIEYRTLYGSFTVKKDLTKVKGIGPKTYQNLQHLITVE